MRGEFSFSGVFLAVLVTFLVAFGGAAGEVAAVECSSSPCTVDNNINLFYGYIGYPVASDECGLDDPCSTTPMIHVGKYGGTCLGLNKVEDMRAGFNGLGGWDYSSGNLYIELSDQASSGRKSFATFLINDGINDWKRYVTYPKDKAWLESNGLLEPDPWCSGNKYSYYIYFWDDGWWGDWQIKNTYLYLLYKSNSYTTEKVTFSVPVSRITSAELVFDVTGSDPDDILAQGRLKVYVYDGSKEEIFNNWITGSKTKRIDIKNYLKDSGVYFEFVNEKSSDYRISNVRIEYTVVCSDGTPYGQCSINKPKYCDNGNLVDNCQLCNCSYGYYCKGDGSCGQDCTSGPCCDTSTGRYYEPSDNHKCSDADSCSGDDLCTYNICDGSAADSSACTIPRGCTDCGNKDCDVNNYYFISGDNSPEGTSYCKYRDYADCNRPCSSAACQDCSCDSYSDLTQATAGICQYIDDCSGSTSGTVKNYPQRTSCGIDMECDGNGNCVEKCDCTEWVNKGCGQGVCSPTEMYQTRTCDPGGCDSESRCVESLVCTAENIVCTSGDDCGTSETCSNGICSPVAPEIVVWKDSSPQDKTYFDASKAINKIMKMKHDPGDITWSDARIIVNIYSVNPGYSTEKIYLYPCKKFSPTECLTQGTMPVVAHNRLYDELRFYDISEREGIATYPQIANLLTFVKLRGPDNKINWVAFWDKIERTDYNFPAPYHHNYNLDILEYYEKNESLTRGIKYFIDNRLMVPFNNDWVEKAVFQGVKRGNVVIGNVYNLYAIGASGAELDNELETFDIAVTNTNEVTAINKDYYFVFPNSTNGKIANPLTLNLNPKCMSDSDCGSSEICLNGQCLPPDECSEGETRCNGYYKQVCGNYDEDPYLEWPLSTSGEGNYYCFYGCENGECISCECSSWSNRGCGLDVCSLTKMYQTRTCTPSGCNSESRCIDDPSCQQECTGTDTSCGIYPNCENCNAQDGCGGDYYKDYYCVSNEAGCDYISDNCNDCSCSCGGYSVEESIANGNCDDGKDNDCDNKTDSADPDCCEDECSSGQKRCNGSYAQTCGYYDEDTCLEWPIDTSGAGNEYCGETTYGNWTPHYCIAGTIMHNRTVHEKGCSDGECYANETLEIEIIEICEGDTTKDCEVNVFDLARVGLCYGCENKQACWDDCQNADVKPDEVIDIFDLAAVGLNYGRSC